MTNTSTVSESTVLKQPEGDKYIFELSNHKDGGWIRKAKGSTSDRPIEDRNFKGKIDTTLYTMLPIKSRTRLKNGSEVQIQYVPFANTIFVNDYVDEKGVKQLGLRSQNYSLDGWDYKRALNKNIRFIRGILYAENFGAVEDPTLLTFIEMHALNDDAPYANKTSRGRNGILSFCRRKPEVAAAKEIVNLEIEARAATMLASLQKKDKDGNYQYQGTRINALLAMFQGNEIGLDENGDFNQKLSLLRNIVKTKAVDFIEIYDQTCEQHKFNITLASNPKFNLLVIGTKECKFTADANNVRTIVQFSGKTEDERLDEMIWYFMGTKKGQADYRLLLQTIEQVKLGMVTKNN